MSLHPEATPHRYDEVALQEFARNGTPSPAVSPEAAPVADLASTNGASTEEISDVPSRHAEAGRKGAHRIHQLIELGRMYEKEHGLKRGRQRLRQLIELGKVYEAEHGLRTPGPKKRNRLSRMRQQEVLGTLLQCLLRIARPSLRGKLARLIETLGEEQASPQE